MYLPHQKEVPPGPRITGDGSLVRLGPGVTITYKTSSIFCIREGLECRWIYNLVNRIRKNTVLSLIHYWLYTAWKKNTCLPGRTITGDRSLLVQGQRVTPSFWVLGLGGDRYLSYVIYIPQCTQCVWLISTCNTINEIKLQCYQLNSLLDINIMPDGRVTSWRLSH